MMSLHINLLPPVKKTKLNALTKFLFTKELLEMVLFTCAILAIMHLLAWYVLQNAVKDLTESSLLINHAPPTANQEVRQTNALIRSLAAAGAGYQQMTPKIIELATMLPPEIKLNSLSFDRVSRICTFTGTALTRDDLLHFNQVLQTIPWLKNPSNPSSRLFQKDNIDFEVTATVADFAPLSVNFNVFSPTALAILR
jgi:hypothetical protein